MTTNVLFIQGAGTGAYDADRLLAESLRRHFGSGFDVRYPAMPNEGEPPYEEWRQKLDQEVAELPEPVVVVGHSFGASVLIKWLSERQDQTEIAGVFLVASPYWGGQGWRYEGYEDLALRPGFADRLPADVPIFLYHCRDDEIVPFDHLALYAHALPRAHVRQFDAGGHQLNDDLSAVARDIELMPSRPQTRGWIERLPSTESI